MKLGVLSELERKIRNFYIRHKAIYIKGKNNQLIIIDEHGKKSKIRFNTFNGLNIKVVGNNNYIEIHKPLKFHRTNIELQGNNHKCIVKSTDKYICNTTLICAYGNGNSIFIDEGISVENAYIYASGECTKIEIGNDCMISEKVLFKTCDDHCIISNKTGELINHNRNIFIGKHCWLCPNTKILKGSMENNSILATNSVLTADFSKKENVLLGGVSAKIIKEDIDWLRETPKEMLNL